MREQNTNRLPAKPDFEFEFAAAAINGKDSMDWAVAASVWELSNKP